MGQAKARGSFEDRRARSIRNRKPEVRRSAPCGGALGLFAAVAALNIPRPQDSPEIEKLFEMMNKATK